MSKYIVREVCKITQRDDFEDGVVGGARLSVYNINLETETPEEMVEALCEHFYVNEEDMSHDEDDPTILRVARMEDDEGCFVTPHELDMWKAGKMTLYLADYTMTVEEVTPFTLPL